MRRLLRLSEEHPVLLVLVVALAARVLFAIGSSMVVKGDLIPDEGQYIELANYVVDGRSPEEWFPGYGQSLYDSVRVFIVPLVALFEVFGSHRIVGQMFSVVVGAGAATVTTALAHQFLPARFAVGAGLVVALLPSQLLFSGVVLREAHIWLGLALVALGCALLMSPSSRRAASGLVVAAAGLLALAYLREQTLLIAAWGFGLAMLLGPRQWWIPRAALGVAVALWVPLLTGSGLAGKDLVSHALPNAATTRQVLAVGANSAFEEPSDPAREEQTPGAAGAPTTPATEEPGSASAEGAEGTEGAGADAIADRAAAINEEANVSKSIGHIPRGLIDVGFRPLPWETTAGTTLLFARVENLFWYLLYGLAILGTIVAVRRREARHALSFTILVVGMILVSSAMTEGNLGTAFRHRGQILWGAAILAAAGAHWLFQRRAAQEEAVDPPVKPAPLPEPVKQLS